MASHRTYLLSINPYGFYNHGALANYLRDANHVASWWNHIPSIYIFNSSWNVGSIEQAIRPFMHESQHLLIEVNPHNCAGLLPPAAWQWLNAGGTLDDLLSLVKVEQ